MRTLLIAFFLFFTLDTLAQKQVALPHGMVYGNKPDTSLKLPITKLDSFMANKARISAAVQGKVLKVTKPKGGWFLLDAGNGKTVEAHFRDYKVSLPRQLAGRIVIIQGVAAKQFKADPSQHYAGYGGTKKAPVKASKKTTIDFEVAGLMIYK